MTLEEQKDLALEIVELQDEIEENKKHNKRARLRCNLKKIGTLSKIGMALTAVPIAGTLITCAAGWNPFKLNEEEMPAIITTTIDRDGKETEKKEYGSPTSKRALSYYTAWEPSKEGNYRREVYEYSLTLSIDEAKNMKKLINSTQEMAFEQIEELFRNSSYRIHGTHHVYESMTEEYMPQLPDTDLNNGGYVELKIIQTDESDTILKKESMGEHVGLFVDIAFLELLIMAIELLVLPFTKICRKWKEQLQDSPYYINTKASEQELKALQMIFEELPYQILTESQTEQGPQKTLKKEPTGYQQQGQ